MIENIGTFFLALWTADFIAGFVHWLEDGYCNDGLPLIGSYICEPNRLHHEDPSLMVRTGSLLSRIALPGAASLSMCVVLWLFGQFSMYALLVAFFLTIANEVHAWNHSARPSRAISWVLDFGIFQDRKQHAKHHRPPHETNYCVLTSHLNPILDCIGFWRLLEAALAMVGIRKVGKDLSR